MVILLINGGIQENGNLLLKSRSVMACRLQIKLGEVKIHRGLGVPVVLGLDWWEVRQG